MRKDGGRMRKDEEGWWEDEEGWWENERPREGPKRTVSADLRVIF